MLESNWFLQQATQQGGFISGVPCSYVAGLYSTLERGGWPYLPATSEGEGVAIAAGTWLGGRQGIVLCQNSGLGNMVNPLTSLIAAFRIPVILGVSRRGWPSGTDEPQHELMGAITVRLLELMALHVETLPADPVIGASLLAQATERAAARPRARTAVRRRARRAPAGRAPGLARRCAGRLSRTGCWASGGRHHRLYRARTVCAGRP
jgi:phosphonopyruvate decarboxylase